MELQDVLIALQNADAAGDTRAAQQLAQLARTLQSQQSTAEDRLREFERRKREERMAPRPEPEVETTFGGNVKETFKGIVPGAIGLAETAGTGIAALLPEETEKSVRSKIKEYADIAKKPFEAAEGYEDSVGRKLGEGLGSTLPFFLAGPLGVAGRVGAGGLGVAAGAGESRQRAEAEGATDEERRLATQLGAPTGLLDLLAPQIGPLKSIITTALARGGVEGATEAAQQIAQNLISKGVYKPEQEIIEGSGEAGAYGAGVGAIASVILDLTLGRKARQANFGEKPEAPAAAPEGEKTAETLALPRPTFTSDEITAARAQDIKTSDPLAGLDEFTQKLARRGKESALTEAFAQEPEKGQIGLPGMERADGTVEVPGRGRVAGTPAAEEVRPAKEPGVVRDDRTRDMVDELETTQIEELEAEEQSARLRKELETQKAEAKQERLKMESDIAELDGRIKAKQEKTTQDKRLALLLPLVESDVKNIPKLFVNTLKAEGFTNTNLTDRERNLINRAYDVRLAEEPVAKEAEVEPSAPAENTAMEAAIPEKKAQREPEQMGFPGMGKLKYAPPMPEAFSKEELASQEEPFTGRSGEAPRSYTSTAPFPTVLSADVLTQTGLPKQSGFYKQLLDMDMADPAQQPVIANIFAKVRTNDNVKPATKQAIERMAMQAFGGLAKQQDMFPKGKKGAKPPKGAKEPAKEKPSEKSGTVAEPTGTSAGDREPSVQKPAAAKQPAPAKSTEAPKSDGLGDSRQPVRDAGDGKGVESGALKEEPQSELDKALAKFGQTTGRLKAAVQKLKAADAANPKMLSEALDILAERRAATRGETKTEAKTEKPKKAEPTAQFGAYGQIAEADSRSDALNYLAYDMYVAMFEKFKLLTRTDLLNDINAQLSNGKIPDDVAFGREGTTSIVPLSGGKYAKAFYESLSEADRTALAKKMSEYFGKSEAEVRRGTESFNTNQLLSRAVKEQMEAEELRADAVRIFASLHPAVAKALKSGNLVQALGMLAGTSQSRAAKLARALAQALSGVKVEVVKDLKNKDGVSLAGLYDPNTNTIKLDAETGMNAHALMHEVTHAVVHKVLSNKAHPLTKQLTSLFNTLKGQLGTAYGSRSLDDFVSETFSNPEFQQSLAQMLPDGKPISAWRRFMNAVGNFMRGMLKMSPRGMNSALDAADGLIMQVVSPNGMPVGSLYDASLTGTAKDVFRAMDDTIVSMPMFSGPIASRVYDFIRSSIPNTTKRITLRSLPLNALTEVAQNAIPMAKELNVLEQQWAGVIDKRRKEIDATYQRIQKWIKGNPEKEQVLSELISKSTREEVHPGKPRDGYKGQTSKSNQDKQQVWDSLQADWNKLGAEGQQVYEQMRKSYEETHTKLLDLLFNRIKTSVKDPAEVEKLRAEVYQRLAVKGKIDPYFPLSRTGDHWLSFHKDGEYYKMAFENSVQRDRAAKELAKESGVSNIEKTAPTGKRTFRDAPPTSFVNSVLKVLEANKVDKANPEVIDEIMRVFLDTLPESSFAQAFRKRLGTLGEDKDAVNVFYKKSISMAHQLGNLEYGAKMYDLRDRMQEHVDTKNKSEEARMLYDALESQIKTMVAPDIAPWAKTATSVAFGFTLGFNLSSAVINTTQLPMVVAPYLGGKYGMSNASKAVGAATKMFFGSGRVHKSKMSGSKDSFDMKAGYSIDNYDFDAKSTPDNIRDLKELAELSNEHGLLNRSVTGDLLDMNQGKDGALEWINNRMGFIFHHGERMNRQVAMIAAYNLELDRMRKGGKKLTAEDRKAAAQLAIDTTELLNGGATANSAPLLAKSSLGKVVFMYKRYGVSMYYMLFKTAKESLASADPEVRKAAKRQIAGIYGMSALLAGAQGVPLFGTFAAMYNLFLRDDDDDDAETATRKYMGEGLYNGALNYLTGTAVAGRVGLSDLLLSDTGYRNQDNALLSFLQLMGGPVYGTADRVIRGAALAMDGEVYRGTEQMLPSAVSNVLKGYRYATEGALTRRGDPITEDIGIGHSFAQALGFAPAEYVQQLEINAAGKNTDRRVTKLKSELLQKYYVALRNGDSSAAQDHMEELQKLGQRHPGQVTADTIKRSLAQHMRTTAQMVHGVSYSKGMRNELLQNAAEFDDDVSIWDDD